MEIEAQIVAGIRYKPSLKCELNEVSMDGFDINSAKSSCLISDGQDRVALSKWVSPKRTRSYPYERVYNTFSASKRVTVIPIVKDEGASGDRDFLQWDTISLMSLLDVYVILAYYEIGEKHRSRIGKITNQKFNSDFVIRKVKEITNYHSSALHWNLKELSGVSEILQAARESYKNIETKTGVSFHSEKGLDNFAAAVTKDLAVFMDYSRLKAQSAQSREFQTIQPKEILATLTKAKITITNYLGGKYFFTVDEADVREEQVFLIESKHSVSGKIPSTGDIKDGLLKMMLYTNLENVKIGGITFSSIPILKLTSAKIEGRITSDLTNEELKEFFRLNKFNLRQSNLISGLFAEAKENNFIAVLAGI